MIHEQTCRIFYKKYNILSESAFTATEAGMLIFFAFF